MKKKVKKDLLVHFSFTLLLVKLFVVLVGLDQLIKAYARTFPLGEQHILIPHVFWWNHLQNTGASFSILQGNNMLLIWISFIVLGLLLWFHDEFTTVAERVCYTLILAGLIGNLIDRIIFGSVTDMFDLGWWPVFNIADICLVVGVIGLIVYTFISKRSHSRSHAVSHH